MNAAEFQALCVQPECSLREALQRLDQTARGILLLVQADGRLLRTVTDGDLRRALLAHRGEDEPLSCLPPQTPITLTQADDASAALRLMDQYQIDQVPVLGPRGEPLEVVFRRELTQRVWLSSPHLGDEETAFVQAAFDSNWIAPLGPNVDGFERELAAQVGVGHAAALSSGTAALHLGLLLLGVQPGDLVFCSSLTFVGSCNPIRYCGAEPVLIDSEPQTWNMSPQALERAFAWAQRQGRLPRCVVLVNLYGLSADMDALLPICQHYRVPVLEDAAESLGAQYKGRASGSFGQLGVYSFNGNKIITTSGGGMLVSDDAALVARARKLSTQARESARHYEHTELGFNYRLSNVLAGIGRGQLRVLAQRVAQRRQVFDRYCEALADLPQIVWQPEPQGSLSNRWLSCFTLQGPLAGAQCDTLLRTLERHSIEARPVWKPMHLQPLYRNAPYFAHEENNDISARLFATGLCLPSGSNLTLEQQERVVQIVRRTLAHTGSTP